MPGHNFHQCVRHLTFAEAVPQQCRLGKKLRSSTAAGLLPPLLSAHLEPLPRLPSADYRMNVACCVLWE